MWISEAEERLGITKRSSMIDKSRGEETRFLPQMAPEKQKIQNTFLIKTLPKLEIRRNVFIVRISYQNPTESSYLTWNSGRSHLKKVTHFPRHTHTHTHTTPDSQPHNDGASEIDQMVVKCSVWGSSSQVWLPGSDVSLQIIYLSSCTSESPFARKLPHSFF